MAALIILSGFYFLRCTNPFTTRDAEKPGQDFTNSQSLTMQLEPDSLIKKMETAFLLREKTYYTELFTTNTIAGQQRFTFIPQENNNTGYFDQWDLTDEQKYFSDIVDNPGLVSLSLNLSPNPAESGWVQINDESADSLRGSFYYTITVNITNEVRRYSGEARFKIIKDQYYTIYHWQDLAVTNYDSTWSTLKRNPLSDE